MDQIGSQKVTKSDLKDGPYRTDYLKFDAPGFILNEILIFSKVNTYYDKRISFLIFLYIKLKSECAMDAIFT